LVARGATDDFSNESGVLFDGHMLNKAVVVELEFREGLNIGYPKLGIDISTCYLPKLICLKPFNREPISDIYQLGFISQERI
jgi:hypothetical protein